MALAREKLGSTGLDCCKGAESAPPPPPPAANATLHKPSDKAAKVATRVERMVYLLMLAQLMPSPEAGQRNSHDIAVSSAAFLTARTDRRCCRPRISTSCWS